MNYDTTELFFPLAEEYYQNSDIKSINNLDRILIENYNIHKNKISKNALIESILLNEKIGLYIKASEKPFFIMLGKILLANSLDTVKRKIFEKLVNYFLKRSNKFANDEDIDSEKTEKTKDAIINGFKLIANETKNIVVKSLFQTVVAFLIKFATKLVFEDGNNKKKKPMISLRLILITAIITMIMAFVQSKFKLGITFGTGVATVAIISLVLNFLILAFTFLFKVINRITNFIKITRFTYKVWKKLLKDKDFEDINLVKKYPV